MRKLFITVVLAIVTLGLLCGSVFAQEISKQEKRRLILKGSKLWPVYCNQCHNGRPPGEKAPFEWDQEIMHMRMLGNIPADDARALVEYLKTR